VALTQLDRDILRRCLSHQPGAWNDFVDRYLGLIYHVIHHTAHQRSAPLQPEDIEDLAAEILLQLVAGDYAVLRQFKGQCSLATYLTVVARRICVHQLAHRTASPEVQPANHQELDHAVEKRPRTPRQAENLDEIEGLLKTLHGKEREVIRLRYLEGRSYEEISAALHIPVNSIGPVLARAKNKLRKSDKEKSPE
jgi:RNA polymerase sigma-70 factor, ECF subfamily